MRRETPLVLAATALVISTVAEAQLGLGDDTFIQAANQFEFYWDNDVEETVVDDRLDVTVSRGAFTLGGTFLSHSPSDPGRLDPNDFGEQVQGLRKRWLEVQTDDFRARVGDVYATFGRGLILNIFEDQTVDFDNVLDGFYGSADLNDRVTLEVISGTNSLGDEFQTLKGAQASFYLPKNVTVGLEGVWSDSLGTELTGRPGGDRLYGGHAGGSLTEYIDYYGEYVVRDARNFREGGSEPAQGHGGYANVSLYLGQLQLLGEYKDFLRYVTENINPPTAFRSHASTLLNRGSHVANLSFADEKGGLVEALLTVTDQTRIAASYGETVARKGNFPAWEAYGEIEQWFGHSELVLRAAETEETIREGSDDIFFERITYSGTLVHPLNDVLSVDLTVETQEVQEVNKSLQNTRFPLEYRDNVISATLNKSPNMSWAVTVEWSDNPREDRDNWVWGEWNIAVGDRHQLNLAGGQLRGGQLCSGGVCKLVDPFQGVKVEFLTTF